MSKAFKMGIAGILATLALAIPERDSQAQDGAGCCVLTGEPCGLSQNNCPRVQGNNFCSVGCTGTE